MTNEKKENGLKHKLKTTDDDSKVEDESDQFAVREKAKRREKRTKVSGR